MCGCVCITRTSSISDSNIIFLDWELTNVCVFVCVFVCVCVCVCLTHVLVL